MGELAAQRLSARLTTDLPLVVDGGVGAALARAGIEIDTPYGTAVAMHGHTEALAAIHGEFVGAGVHVVRTNTAETTAEALQRSGYGYRAAKLSNGALDAATEAADASGQPVAVAGVLPAGVDRDALLAHAQRLAVGGSDLLWVAGARSLGEAVAATSAATHMDKLTLVELHLDDDARLESDGEGLARVVSALTGIGAAGFVGVTRSEQAEQRALVVLADQRLPFGLQRARCEIHPDDYAGRVAGLVRQGARILGGDAHATPDHVRALFARVPRAARELKRPSLIPPAG